MNRALFTYLNPKFTELFGYDLTDVPNGREWYKSFSQHQRTGRGNIDGQRGVKNTKPGQRTAKILTVTCKDGMKKNSQLYPCTFGDKGIPCQSR